MKRALWALMFIAACDLDLFGAHGEYCAEHPQACRDGGQDAGALEDGGLHDAGGADGGAFDAGRFDGGSGIDTWCERFAEASCARALRCNQSGATDCYEATIGFCARSERPRVLVGARRFDPVAAETCLAQINSATCTLYSIPCTVTAPNARLGARCEDSDCTEGYCSGVSRNTLNGQCPVCVPFVPIGASCVSLRCDPSTSYCADFGDGGRRCEALKPDGEPCNGEPQICASFRCPQVDFIDGGAPRCGALPIGSTCQQPSDCADTAYCAQLRQGASSNQNGVCRPRIALGQSCVDEQFEDGCADGGTCLGAVCRLTTTQRIGQPCESALQCLNSDCSDPGPFGPQGQPQTDDGICVDQPTLGEPCFGLLQCAVGLYCALDGGCASPLPEGTACDPSLGAAACGVRSCVHHGDGGYFCEAPALPGERCQGRACPRTYNCISFDGGAPTCQRRPVGVMCAGPPQCESFRCDTSDAGWLCAPSCF